MCLGWSTACVICVATFSITPGVPIFASQSPVPGIQGLKPNQPSDPLALLKSSEPREQAWGAWYAGQNRLYSAIPLLEAVVSSHLTSALQVDRGAADVALDALIQLDAQISPELIQFLFEWRPTQALVLSRSRGTAASN